MLLVGGDDFSRNMDSGKKGMWTFFADEENLSFDSKDLELVAEVFEDGYYNIKVLGTDLKNLSVQVNKDYRYDFSSSDSLTLYLGQGINLFNFSAQNLSKAKINLRKVKSLPEQTKIYQAEAEANERGSRVTLTKDGNAVEQKNHSVTSEQFLTIKNIFAEKAGTYAVTVRYQNGELGDGAANYNSNIVDRSAFLKVNGSPALSSRKVFFRNTLGWKDWYTLTFSLQLEEGNNSISFVAPEHKKLPTVDFISVSPLVLEKSVSGFEDASPLLQLSPATSVRYPRQIELNAIFADDTFANSDVKIKWSTKNKKVRFINADSPFAKAEVSKAGNYTFTCTVSDGKYSVSKDLTATVYPEGMYEAEDEKNIINGQARIAASSLASNKKIVGYIGMGEQNSLVFTNIKAKKKGNHKITLYYISGENRKVLLYVNNKSPIWVECPSTGDWSKVGSVSVKVKLEKGDNTITFKNPLNYAPDIDCIVVE